MMVLNIFRIPYRSRMLVRNVASIRLSSATAVFPERSVKGMVMKHAVKIDIVVGACITLAMLYLAPLSIAGARDGGGEIPSPPGGNHTSKSAEEWDAVLFGWEGMKINAASPDTAFPGETVTLHGWGFGGSTGDVVLTGLRVDAMHWSDTRITFVLPDEGASGSILVRDASGENTDSVTFTVARELTAEQFAPDGLVLVDTGWLGAAFLVETDGEYLYAITGFERLATYRITGSGPYELCSCLYLPQRVGDLRVHGEYLLVAGDHGLYVYRCSDLHGENPVPAAAVAGGSFMAVDAKEKNGEPVDGTLIALCEYRPLRGAEELRVPLYQLISGELVNLGTYVRSGVIATERQHAIAVDPINPKVYVSGFKRFLGSERYILEIDVSDPDAPFCNHREETGSLLAFDMDALGDHLWTGIFQTGTALFKSFGLQPGSEHLYGVETVSGGLCLGRTTRLKILDGNVTAGSAWLGERPDVFLLETFDNGPSVMAEVSTPDWAFDVTGYPEQTVDYDGSIIVADEWGGFLTYGYRGDPDYSITHEPERQVIAGAMTEGLHLREDRIYIAGRGAGPWSADRFDLTDESSWRGVEWDWALDEPQPYPVSALCTREDPEMGTLVVGLGHEKAMAWGHKIYGILYRETAGDIAQLAMSEEVDPAGLWSIGVDAVWAETDLVFMTTGSDGFRAYVVDPDPVSPSISLHRDCLEQGFGREILGQSNPVQCMRYCTDGVEHRIIVGTHPGLFVQDPTIHVFDVAYPQGVPDRDNPDRSIVVEREYALNCTATKTVDHLDVSPSGLVAFASTQGVAVLHVSWVPYLNTLGNNNAWNLIQVPKGTYKPLWGDSWTKAFKDVSFDGDDTIYCVKNPVGVWKVGVTIDWENHTHDCVVEGFYPGVECGIDYNNMLAGWGNPDITTLHHPYAVTAHDGSAYVTAWSGKVYRLCDNQP